MPIDTLIMKGILQEVTEAHGNEWLAYVRDREETKRGPASKMAA